MYNIPFISKTFQFLIKIIPRKELKLDRKRALKLIMVAEYFNKVALKFKNSWLYFWMAAL